MKQMRKSTLVLSVIASSLLMATACSSETGKGTDKATTQPNTASDAAASKLPEPATLRVFTENQTAWPAKADWGTWKWVKEETNITVKQELATGPESLSLSVSSGDMPDVLSVFPNEVQKFGPQGAFLDLSKYMDKMPNVKAYLKANPDIRERITMPGGEIYSIINDGAGAGSQMVWFYREDIFKKNNLQVPKTWDELYETSKKLKELYPDSYPFVFRHGIATLDTFSPSFGFYPSFYQDPKTGKMDYGMKQPAAKSMITYLNKFQKDKLIPPDWLTMDYKAWTQFMSSNKSFITVQFIGQIEIMNNQLKEGNLKFMAPPVGVGTQPYLPRGGTEEFGFAVASKTTKQDAALRYLDYIYSEKGKDIQSWGKEGETYTIEGGKRKFKPVYKEANDLRRESGIQTAGTYGWFDFNAWLALVKESEQFSYQEAPKYRFPTYNRMPVLTQEEAASIAVPGDQLFKFYTSSLSKFILGETPLTEWDKFTQDLDKYDLKKMLSTYQTALDRQKANASK
ncbi:ABC transporter substrate-binding protein [Paenibacillus marchantiophytorum]|uniref:ABC transporter substrate-binding protein n=1 Tax=Paenibacillus marchantiophytorum TaxID=1619310 RepID=A0ABQ1ELT6_9BACL|nr:extracellular solute-binding protein [Paenibacillus marchantiophytorum]GFZ77570.1 ABC transporter substrate-binding protein [Paenibacillus marchantiophytorum]